MDKQLLNKGFTLIETLIVLVILSLFVSIFYASLTYKANKPIQYIVNEIVITQFKAIIEDEKQYYENDQHELYFNRKGGPNQANTFDFDEISIVVSLGTGRVYVKR